MRWAEGKVAAFSRVGRAEGKVAAFSGVGRGTLGVLRWPCCRMRGY